MSEQWMGLHNPPWHEKVLDRKWDCVCLLCRSRCAEDECCRCCLAAEVEALREERDALKHDYDKAAALVHEGPLR